jgi:hypothetical protein
MTKQRKTTGFLNRTAQALGKFWAGVVAFPDDRKAANQAVWTDFPRFPPF